MSQEGVPLNKLKGWPNPVNPALKPGEPYKLGCEMHMEDAILLTNTGTNQCLKALGNKRLTVDVENLCRIWDLNVDVSFEDFKDRIQRSLKDFIRLEGVEDD